MSENPGNVKSIVEFEELLPLLVSTYKRGRLVPFIGAGLSSPKLQLWPEFVDKLEDLAEIPKAARAEDTLKPAERVPDRRAERAVQIIKHKYDSAAYVKQVQAALPNPKYNGPIPQQTTELARIHWPLVISTNYDALYYTESSKIKTELPPEVLGRSSVDCKRVIASLSSPLDREILWHIQGFVGSQPNECPFPFDQVRLKQLQAELVVGHSDYRRVTNTDIHFQRCFTEVFRSRSFLFVGSSLSEQYFENLFGEVFALCGPSPVPHFAFVLKDTLDRQFLAEQLNILTCELSSWPELPQRLNQLAEATKITRAAHFHVRIPPSLNRPEESQISELEIVEEYPSIQSRTPDEAIAFIVRRAEPRFKHYTDAQRKELEEVFAKAEFASQVTRCPSDQGLFAVTAKESVSSALSDLFLVISECTHKIDVLHVVLPAKGGAVPAVYGFMEALRSLKRLTTGQLAIPKVMKFSVGPHVMLNLTSMRIDPLELLTSDLIRFWVIVDEGDVEPKRRIFCYSSGTKLDAVLQDLNIPITAQWTLSACPSTHHSDGPRTVDALAGKTLAEIVVFGSTLYFQRGTDIAIKAKA